MSLINDFIQLLTCNIDEYTKWLEEHHNVPKDLVIEKWNDLTGLTLLNENNSIICADIQDPEIVIQRSGTTVPYLCQYVFKIGARKGQQCTKKPKEMATFCSSHKEKPNNNENEDNEEKKLKKKSKHIVQKTPKSKEFIDDTSDNEDKEKEITLPKKKKTTKRSNKTSQSDTN